MELAKTSDIPAQYVHPQEKQCNYEPDLSNYATKHEVSANLAWRPWMLNVQDGDSIDFAKDQDYAAYMIIVSGITTSYGGNIGLEDSSYYRRSANLAYDDSTRNTYISGIAIGSLQDSGANYDSFIGTKLSPIFSTEDITGQFINLEVPVTVYTNSADIIKFDIYKLF